MAYTIDNPSDVATFTAYGTVSQNALVKVKAASATSPVQVYETEGTSDADQATIGVALETATTGNPVAVRLLNRGGIVKVLANENNIAVDDVLYTAASGRASNVATSDCMVGIAIEASAAQDDVIAMAPQLNTVNALGS